jgi:choline dehydrogenase-like flavoprotein
MLTKGLEGLEGSAHDLVVIGSGPVGLALATDLVRRGRRVLLLESGGPRPDETIQTLSQGELVDPARHDDLMIAAARSLGGSSNLWGARALPYDPIDFRARPWIDARWPITYADVAAYFPRAVKATASGAPVYREAIPGFTPSDDAFSCDTLERWANQQKAQVIHAEAIDKDPNLDVRLYATVTGMDFAEDGRILALNVADSRGGESIRLPVGTVVLAGGGLESTRLLLAAQREAPARFGGPDGPLGRYYMGHVLGKIADIVMASDAIDAAMDFRVDAHGSYVRRRLVPSEATQMEHQLLNVAFWPVVPAISDPRHGNAILSMLYLAMSYGPLARLIIAEAIRKQHIPPGPPMRGPHLVNLVRGLPAAAIFLTDFFKNRYFSETRVPGFFVRNRARRYGLMYHCEQSPDPDSRVVLSGAVNRLGLPELKIDLRFSQADAAALVRTHALMQDWLTRTGFGRLEFHAPEGEREALVLKQAIHGTHQIGLIRMASSRSEGLVDGNLRAFDAPNLYVASTAVLPTSGQANPTFTTVALALRLADHLMGGEG